MQKSQYPYLRREGVEGGRGEREKNRITNQEVEFCGLIGGALAGKKKNV